MASLNDDFMQRAHLGILRRIDAPVARVFRAWTHPDYLSHWMWASLSKDVWAEVDLRIGGAYRIYTRFDGGQHQGDGWSGMCGIYADIVENQKLVYSVHWDANVGYNQGGQLALDEIVSVEFEADGDTTQLDYRHFGIPDDGQSANTHRVGIEESFDLLQQLICEPD